MANTAYDLEFQSLHQRIHSHEAEVNSFQAEISSLQAELERIRTRNKEVELTLSSQTALIDRQDAKMRALDLEVSHVKNDLVSAKAHCLEVEDKNKGLQEESVKQVLYILELQETVSKGVEESGQLWRDLKKVQDLLASMEQDSAKKLQEYSDLLAKKEDGNATLKLQLSKKRELIKTQSELLEGNENDKNGLRTRIAELEAQNAKLESDQRSTKNKLQKKIAHVYQSNFTDQLLADWEKTKYGTIWRTMNAVFTAYPDLGLSKIFPFLDPKTPMLSWIPALKAQYDVRVYQGSGSTPSGSEAPSGSKTPSAGRSSPEKD